jgi:ketosteroid isomerase-like protein
MADAYAEEESEFLKALEEGNRAWNEGDFKRAYGALPEDFEYELAANWPDARTLRGPDEVVAFFEAWRETFPDTRADLREFIQADERTVIVGFKVIGTGERSGVGTTMEIWQVWTLREGLVPVRVSEFHDRRAAIDAAGAREPTEASS